MSTLTYQDYINLMQSGIVRPILLIEMIRSDGSIYDSFTKYPILGSSLTISNQNGCRRSCNLILDNSDKKFIPDPNNGMLWMNTQLKISLGVENELGDTIFFPLGIFCLVNSQPEIISDFSSRTVNLKCDDKWSILQTNLGSIYQIPLGTKISDVVKSILKLCGDEQEPIIQDLPGDLTPYTMRWSPSDTYDKVLKDLANLYSRDIYYNETGHLVLEEFRDVSIQETQWRYSPEDVTYMGSNRVMQFDKVINHVVVISSNSSGGTYRGEATNTDLTSPTRVGFVPTRTLTIQDDKLYSDDLCVQRAKYELSQRIRIQESIALKSLCLPHFTCNKAITITDDALGLNYSRYSVQSLQMPLDMKSQMTITAYKFTDDEFMDRTSVSASTGT